MGLKFIFYDLWFNTKKLKLKIWPPSSQTKYDYFTLNIANNSQQTTSQDPSQTGITSCF